MGRYILRESELRSFIKRGVIEALRESNRFMSDEDIASQYSGMKINYFEIEPSRSGEGWTGTFELEFPSADGIDYDETMVNGFIVYDDAGDRIAWDNWMPDEQCDKLQDVIRNEIAKRQGRNDESVLREGSSWADGFPKTEGYWVTGIGSDESDEEEANEAYSIYDAMAHRYMTADEAIEKITRGDYSCESSPETIARGCRILGYSKDKKFFLTYDSYTGALDVWKDVKAEEPEAWELDG